MAKHCSEPNIECLCWEDVDNYAHTQQGQYEESQPLDLVLNHDSNGVSEEPHERNSEADVVS